MSAALNIYNIKFPNTHKVKANYNYKNRKETLLKFPLCSYLPKDC